MDTVQFSDFDGIEFKRPPRNDKYVYEKFTEMSAPDLAVDARRVHAAGYESMGFVNTDAFDEDGTLATDIDKARGGHVEYYVGIDPHDQENEQQGVAVTLRKVGIPENGTVNDLPAFALCADAMYPEERAALEAIDDPHHHVKEIGALARAETTNPLATMELIRNVFHEAWTKKTNQTWLISIVSSTYDAFEDNFGGLAIRQIGEPVAFDDERVGEGIKLIPAVVDVDNFLDNIIDAMQADENRAHRARMFRSVMFFSDGLRDEEMSDSVRSLRSEYRAKTSTATNEAA